MAKKWIALYTDAKDDPIKADGPIYGELTDEKVDALIKKAKKVNAKFIQIDRRTDGHFVAGFRIIVSSGKVIRMGLPAGSRYGPGYYSL